MSASRHIKWFIPFFLFSNSLCLSHENAIVDHHDSIQIDQSLTLSQVINLTLKKYPDLSIGTALKLEADALQQRGNSLLAGAPSIDLRYQDDLPGDNIGLREIETALELPLWNWGQRSAGQSVAERAYKNASKQSSVIKLKVAGLVRNALWDIKLTNLRYQQAKSILDISQKLLAKIKRRVELGDLPRADLLLAQSDRLQKRSLLIQAEAEMMHARKSYMSLTQLSTIPADYKEQQSPVTEITEDHPELAAINAEVERKQAEIGWIKSEGSGQTRFILGGKSENGGGDSDDIESMSIGLSIPFGGSAHLAPEVAAANLELTKILALRGHVFRELKRQYHEAKHALDVIRFELKIADELKQIAQEHLKMTNLSFSAGEINLLDLLKIQARSNNAIGQAKERAVILQKNIALYNQSVGVLP